MSSSQYVVHSIYSKNMDITVDVITLIHLIKVDVSQRSCSYSKVTKIINFRSHVFSQNPVDLPTYYRFYSEI